MSKDLERQFLPDCKGPKLNRFIPSGHPIEFVRLLSNNDGIHSHVFQVIIDSKHYALKLFKFYTAGELWPFFTPDRAHLLNAKLVVGQLDPFYAECRAFGRIQGQGRNGKVAVRCYGFTFVPVHYEKLLKQKFGVSDWNRRTEHKGQPFRGIVKDFVSETVPFTTSMIRKMKCDLAELNRMGVYVKDIRVDNYRGGVLLDFSIAWTRPHIMMWRKAVPVTQISLNMKEDEFQFDDMIDEANEKSLIRTWIRFQPSESFLTRLRSGGKRKFRPLQVPKSILEEDPAGDDEVALASDSTPQKRRQEEPRKDLRPGVLAERQHSKRSLPKRQRHTLAATSGDRPPEKRPQNTRGARKTK